MLPPTDSVCNIGVRLSRLVGVCIRQTILPLLSTASPYAACPALVMQHHCQLIYRCHCRFHVPGNIEEPRPIAQDRCLFCAAWHLFCFVLFGKQGLGNAQLAESTRSQNPPRLVSNKSGGFTGQGGVRLNQPVGLQLL